MHGYDNQAADMHPFLVAMGPGIKQRGTIQTFQQIDVYPLVCMLLDIFKPNRIDGDVNRVLPLLSNPPSNDKIQQFILYAKGTPDSSSCKRLGGFMLMRSNQRTPTMGGL